MAEKTSVYLQVGVTTYREIQLADGLAMDTAGNLLIADHNKGKVEVYSLCGALIKTIPMGTQHAVDVEINIKAVLNTV